MGVTLVPNTVREATSRAIGPVASRMGTAAQAVMLPPTRIASFAKAAAEVGVDALDIPRRTRRLLTTEGRTVAELRDIGPDPADITAYVLAVTERLSSIEGVAWAEALPKVGRVVVAHDDTVGPDAIRAAIDDAERSAGVTSAPLGGSRPDHPGDIQPSARIASAIAADGAGLGLGVTGRVARVPALPVQVDLAALMTIASYVPMLRSRIDRVSTSGFVDLGLIGTRAVLAGAAQNLGGPTFDIVHRVALLNAAESRRRVWERRFGELTERPSGLNVASLTPSERVAPMPDGPIEHLGRPTWVASVGGAAAALLWTRSLDRVIQMLVAGVPKAQAWGRQGMTAQVTRFFGDRNVLVMNPGALEALDRIDTLVLESDLVLRTAAGGRPEPEPLAAEILGAAREAGVSVWLATDVHLERVPFEVDGIVGPGTELAGSIRRMQDDGHAVLYAGHSAGAAVDFADLSFGLVDGGRPTPWNADLIGTTDVGDIYLLLQAVRVARVAARQTAQVALAGAGVGGLMAVGGVIPGSTRRIMGATDIAAIAAHVNATRHAVSLTQHEVPTVPDPVPYHALSPTEAIMAVGSSPDGLSSAQAAERRQPAPHQPSTLNAIARNVADEAVNPLTPILAAGAGLSAAAGSPADALLVGGVLGVNALVGGVQRHRAEQALADLSIRERNRVVATRDGERHLVDADSIVIGDLIHVQAGEVVPADCRIVRTTGLEVDESSLTGESVPVFKHMDPCPADAAVADRSSMLYAGTTVAAGSAHAVTVAVGHGTEAYRGLIGGTRHAGGGVEARLESITSMVTPLSVIAGLGVLASGLLRQQPVVDVLSTGVSLAVAAVPEGLPLLATVAQHSAARRLTDHGVIVRNARSIEALGRIDTCCVDKTGTVTVGRLRVRTVSDGETVEPHKELTGRRAEVARTALAATPAPRTRKKLPHPTDRAVWRLGRQVDGDDIDRIAHLPFEPARGYHAELVTEAGTSSVVVKGAPEVVLPRCSHWRRAKRRTPMTSGVVERLEEHVDELASRGLRILAVARRPASGVDTLSEDDVDGLTLLGFIGLKDPVRPTAPDAIADLEAAGVRVVMLTGDHPSTAVGIAHELGIDRARAVTGVEIEAMTDDELLVRMRTTTVCARVTPAHKVRIVRALQRDGCVVSMTGDGANDAAAIRLADVGVALGTRATEAARDASDIVVTDDRIETIVAAVVEGRALWRSVRDATAILVGGNIGEVIFILGGSLIQGRPPLNARQLLLVNLLTDVAPAMAIAASKPDDLDPHMLLEEGPDQSLAEPLNRAIAVRATATAAGTTMGWIAGRLTGRRQRASTVALASLVSTELGQTIAVARHSPLVVGSSVASFGLTAAIIQTPGISHFFGCTPLGPVGWSQALTSATAATLGAQHLDRIIRTSGIEFESTLAKLRTLVGSDT